MATMWVGDLHNEVLKDFRKNNVKWIGNQRGQGLQCAELARTVSSYARQAALHAGIARSDVSIHGSVIASMNRTKECAGISELSVFGPMDNMLTAASMDDEDVSGEFLAYAEQIEPTIQTTNGSPAAVAQVTDGLLASASSLGTNDLNALASATNLAYSSSVYWTTSGGGGGGCEGCPEPMSVFRGLNFPWVIAADVLGCAAGMASAYHSGNHGWRYLAVECFIWGASASGAFFIPVLKM